MAKKKDKLFVQLSKIADNLQATATEFRDYEIYEDGRNMEAFSDKIKELESVGDALVHEMGVELGHAFITPIEHEDLLQLAEHMDEIVDGIEESAIYMDMFQLYKPDPYINDFRNNIALCADEIKVSIDLLCEKKLTDIHEHVVNIKTYEGNCDHLERKAIKELFVKYKEEPLMVIELKDIYQMLEKTVDECQNVAKILDIVVMKNL